MNEENEEQTKLLRSMVKLLLDREYKDETEAEKARYLKDSGYSAKEIARILNKAEGTIKSQIYGGS